MSLVQMSPASHHQQLLENSPAGDEIQRSCSVSRTNVMRSGQWQLFLGQQPTEGSVCYEYLCAHVTHGEIWTASPSLLKGTFMFYVASTLKGC